MNKSEHLENLPLLLCLERCRSILSDEKLEEKAKGPEEARRVRLIAGYQAHLVLERYKRENGIAEDSSYWAAVVAFEPKP